MTICRCHLADFRTKDVNKEFKYVAEIGFGTYGRVFKAISRKGEEEVFALKKLHLEENNNKMEFNKDGFPVTSLREIKYLQKLDHPNIIKFIRVVTADADDFKSKNKSTYLVFEYMEYDFVGLLSNRHFFTLPQIKCIVYQLAQGLQYLHSKNIIHRDLKSANVLYNSKGEVKLADFGLARSHTLKYPYTNKVVTLWYRAPELLLGTKQYDGKIDIWSLGCFFAELVIREVLFRSDGEARQLEAIYGICGSPDELCWPGVKGLALFAELGPKKYCPNNLIPYIKSKAKELLSDAGFDLIKQTLTLDPERRLSSEEVINHPFFTEEPKMTSIKDMPVIKGELHGSVRREKDEIPQGVKKIKRD